MAVDINEEFFEGLTMKEKLFVVAYFKNNYNGAQAVIEAGYATKNAKQMAFQMLQRPHVKAAIAGLGQKRMDEVTVSADYVLRKLIRTVEKAEQSDNYSATLRGLELLAKHLGMFVERQEISGPDGGAIVHEQRVKQDAADFVSKLARLAKSGGAGEVLELPNRRTEGGT